MTVFAGLMYVGNGFRRMAESLDNVMDSPIILDIGPRHNPSYDDPMIIR